MACSHFYYTFFSYAEPQRRSLLGKLWKYISHIFSL